MSVFTHRILFANHSQKSTIHHLFLSAPRLTTNRLQLDADVGKAEERTLLARASTSRFRRSKYRFFYRRISYLSLCFLLSLARFVDLVLHSPMVNVAKALARERMFKPFRKRSFGNSLSLRAPMGFIVFRPIYP